MIKFVLIFIVLAYCDTELISQSKVYGTVCNIRGVEYSKKKDETIEIPLGKEHWIYKYLKKLTDLLEPEKRGFFICSENDSKNAKAFRKVMYDDNESIQ